MVWAASSISELMPLAAQISHTTSPAPTFDPQLNHLHMEDALGYMARHFMVVIHYRAFRSALPPVARMALPWKTRFPVRHEHSHQQNPHWS